MPQPPPNSSMFTGRYGAEEAPPAAPPGGAEEQNPYLEGTPAYMKTLPTKAEEAKQEILEGTESAAEAVRRAQQEQAAAASKSAPGVGGSVRRVQGRKPSRQGYDGADANVNLQTTGNSTVPTATPSTGRRAQPLQAARALFSRRGAGAAGVDAAAAGRGGDDGAGDDGGDDGGGGGGGGDHGGGGGVEWADAPNQAVKFGEDMLTRQPFENPQRRDAGWSFLFCAHALVIFLLAVTMGLPEYIVAVQAGRAARKSGGKAYSGSSGFDDDDDDTYAGDDDFSGSSGSSGGHGGSSSASSDASTAVEEELRGKPSERDASSAAGVVLIGVASAVLGAMCSLGLFELALSKPHALIQFGLGGVVAACCAMACVMIVAGPDVAGALVWSVLAAVAICFTIGVQDRVALASANLACAGSAVKQHRQVLTVAVGGVLAQFGWLFTWLAAITGIALKNHRTRQALLPRASPSYEWYEAEMLGVPPPPIFHVPASPPSPSATAAAATNITSGSGNTKSDKGTSGSDGGDHDDGGGDAANDKGDDKEDDDDFGPTSFGPSFSGQQAKEKKKGLKGQPKSQNPRGLSTAATSTVRELKGKHKHKKTGGTVAPSPMPSDAAFPFASQPATASTAASPASPLPLPALGEGGVDEGGGEEGGDDGGLMSFFKGLGFGGEDEEEKSETETQQPTFLPTAMVTGEKKVGSSSSSGDGGGSGEPPSSSSLSAPTPMLTMSPTTAYYGYYYYYDDDDDGDGGDGGDKNGDGKKPSSVAVATTAAPSASPVEASGSRPLKEHEEGQVEEQEEAVADLSTPAAVSAKNATTTTTGGSGDGGSGDGGGEKTGGKHQFPRGGSGEEEEEEEEEGLPNLFEWLTADEEGEVKEDDEYDKPVGFENLDDFENDFFAVSGHSSGVFPSWEQPPPGHYPDDAIDDDTSLGLGKALGLGVGAGLAVNQGSVFTPDDIGMTRYYGLGAGCRTVLVDHSNGYLFNLNLPNNTMSVACVCSFGAFHSPGQCDSADYFGAELRANVWVYMLFLCSLYWGGQVVAGVVHVTSCGAVAAWWFGVTESAYASSSASASTEQQAYSKLTQQDADASDAEGGGGGAAAAEGGEGGVDDSATESLTQAGQPSAEAKANTVKGSATKAKGKWKVSNLLSPRNKHKHSTQPAPSVVQGALNRAVGPSFGSVCLGALLVAVLSTAETVLRYVRDTVFAINDQGQDQGQNQGQNQNQGGGGGGGGHGSSGNVSNGNGSSHCSKGGKGVCCACLWCLDCFLGALRDVMRYFNRWAFTFVAIYGDDFKTAGKRTHALFQRRGWERVATDTLCNTALTFASLVVSFGVGLVAYSLCSSLGAEAKPMRGVVSFCSALAAYMMCSCATAVLDAGVLTVLVCFAEDPVPCFENHPNEFAALVRAWRARFGAELSDAGYDAFYQVADELNPRPQTEGSGGKTALSTSSAVDLDAIPAAPRPYATPAQRGFGFKTGKRPDPDL